MNQPYYRAARARRGEGAAGMIYVDSPAYRFRGQMYCHMATDGDIQELHEIADRIGLQRSWFQNHPRHPHYDLSPSKRILAIRNGAVEVGSLDLVRICFKAASCAGKDAE